MKNIVFRILILGALVMFSSCEDFFDLLPEDYLVQEDYWKTENDVQQTLSGAYSAAASLDDYYWLFGEVRADMVDYGRMGSANSDFYLLNNGFLDPNDWMYKWDRYYRVINYCNFVIDFTMDVNDQTFGDVQKKQYIAEARFLRALEYFYLVRLFKYPPLVTEPSKNDNQNFYIPNEVTTDPNNYEYEDKIISFIIDELKLAWEHAPTDYPGTLEKKSRATKAAISALLADVYLWRASYTNDDQDYLNCVKYCSNQYIDSTRYVLLEGKKMFENYYPVEFDYSPEVVFEFFRDNNMGQPNKLIDYTWTKGKPTAFAPSDVALELFDDGIDEFRRNVTYIASRDNNFGLIYKYAGTHAIVDDQVFLRTGNELKSANFIVYRYADIMLMKAEALNQLGRGNEALILLNAVRTRADLNSTSASGLDDLELKILEERQKELAFEAKRWFDLVRFGRRNNYAKKADFIGIAIEKVSVTQQSVLANRLNDPNGWFLPIHIDELKRNKNLKQNPFYDSLTNLDDF